MMSFHLINTLGHHESNLFVYIVAAMSAGATSTTITNPLWVIKTRFMVGFQLDLGS